MREWVVERTNTPPVPTEREQAIAALRAAGLLVEPSATSKAKLLSEQERAELADRLSRFYPHATPLSQLVLAEREER